MKTKGHRCGCLLLICAIGLGVGVVTSTGKSKMPLSEEAMGSVYGGCGPCDTKDYDGCHPGTKNCEDKPDTQAGCTGTYYTSCSQEQKECKNIAGMCDPFHWEPCWDVRYTVYTCELIDGVCSNVFQYSHDCDTGSREWCIGEEDPP